MYPCAVRQLCGRHSRDGQPQDVDLRGRDLAPNDAGDNLVREPCSNKRLTGEVQQRN